MKKLTMLVALLTLAHPKYVQAQDDEILYLPPMVVTAEAPPADPTQDFNTGIFDNTHTDWLQPAINNNIIGAFNNFGVLNGNNYYSPPLPSFPCPPVGAMPAFDGSQPTTKVFIGYDPLSALGYYHTFVLIVAPDGALTVVRAGPSGDGPSSGGVGATAGASFGSTAWGNLYAQVIPHGENTADLQKSVNTEGVYITNTSAATIIGQFQSYVNAVNNGHFNYNPFTTNSNAFAFESISAVLGVARPSASAWSPGKDVHLICMSLDLSRCEHLIASLEKRTRRGVIL